MIFTGDFTAQNRVFIPGDLEKMNCEGDPLTHNSSNLPPVISSAGKLLPGPAIS